MTLNSHTPSKKARIEIIPLIDIMFFLLASFMLVSMSMVKLQKIETKLPNARTSAPVKKADFVVIGIDKDGKIFYDKDKDPIPVTDIGGKLGKIYAEKKEATNVFVNCDKAATYNELVAVLDAVRGVGIRNINFAVAKGNTVRGPAAPAAPNP